jgi:hypothetical protein
VTVLLRVVALVTAAALATLIAPVVAVRSATPAGAGGGPPTSVPLSVVPQSHTALTFLVAVSGSTKCSSPSQLVLTITAGSGLTPVTPTSTVNQDANDVLVTLPAGTLSSVQFVGDCLDAGGPIEGTSTVHFGTVNVMKQVQGPDPADTTFTVHFDCTVQAGSTANGFTASSTVVPTVGAPDTTGDLQYGSSGGTLVFYAFGKGTCTLTETNTGGAQSTSISPNPVDVVNPIVYSTTVTNTFPPLALAPAVITAPPPLTRPLYVQVMDSCRQGLPGAFLDLVDGSGVAVTGPVSSGTKRTTIASNSPCPLPRGNCGVNVGCILWDVPIPMSGSATYTIVEHSRFVATDGLYENPPGTAPYTGFVPCNGGSACRHESAVLTIDNTGRVVARTTNQYPDGKFSYYPSVSTNSTATLNDPLVFHNFQLGNGSCDGDRDVDDHLTGSPSSHCNSDAPN